MAVLYHPLLLTTCKYFLCLVNYTMRLYQWLLLMGKQLHCPIHFSVHSPCTSCCPAYITHFYCCPRYSTAALDFFHGIKCLIVSSWLRNLVQPYLTVLSQVRWHLNKPRLSWCLFGGVQWGEDGSALVQGFFFCFFLSVLYSPSS